MAARRKADLLIAAGRVTVNGAPARPGVTVRVGVDRVAVDGKEVTPAGALVYRLLNKPVGVLSTVRDDRGRRTVIDTLPTGERLFPVGRLDGRSRGLILLTNDGALAVRLMHPRYHVEKEYRVTIAGSPADGALRQLQKGMRVGAERYRPAEVEVLRRAPSSTHVRMVLTEGRKREVRRMWKALGHEVIDLERVRLGPLRLGSLPVGAHRTLTANEVRDLRASVGLT